MRALIESVLTHLLLRGDAVRKREDFIELSASLPFYTDPSTVMGIVVKGYCDAVHYMGSEGNSGEQMKQDVIDAMQQAFGSGIRDVKAEVVRSFRFWDCVRFFFSLLARWLFFVLNTSHLAHHRYAPRSKCFGMRKLLMQRSRDNSRRRMHGSNHTVLQAGPRKRKKSKPFLVFPVGIHPPTLGWDFRSEERDRL